MKNVIFYLLKNHSQNDSVDFLEYLVCEISAKYWRLDKRILIACEHEEQAIRLDSSLWIYPTDSFVPHNLSGEGLKSETPIEISWPKKRNSSARDILINLHIVFSDFATTFTEIVDFVPYTEYLKQLARERYKAYQLAGFNIDTAIWK